MANYKLNQAKFDFRSDGRPSWTLFPDYTDSSPNQYRNTAVDLNHRYPPFE